MRLLLALSIAILFGLSPASAMCGGGQQAGGGKCGVSAASTTMSERTAQDWQAAPGQATPEQKPGGMAMGGCPRCKNMAMITGTKADDPHKGMDMQKQ